MSRQPIFKDPAYPLSLLRRLAKNETLLDYYKNSISYKGSDTDSSIVTNGSMPALATEDKYKSDGENAIKIHSFLGNLDRVYGSDPRLWTYLTHVTFRDYTQRRWPLPLILAGDDENSREVKSLIAERWFFEGSKAIAHNALARLWWGAYLTVAPWEFSEKFNSLRQSDEYIYTRLLFSNQDIHTSLIEREVFQSRILFFATLEFLRTNPDYVAKKYIQDLSKELNLIAGIKKVESLSIEEAVVLVSQTAAELFGGK